MEEQVGCMRRAAPAVRAVPSLIGRGPSGPVRRRLSHGGQETSHSQKFQNMVGDTAVELTFCTRSR